MIIFDTETTGFVLPSVAPADQQPRIIDLAAVKMDPMSGEVYERIEFLLDPGMTLPSEITKITGLTDADLKGKPSFATVFPEVVDFFLGERCMLAHNLPFDKSMLYWELIRIGAETMFPYPPQQICTVNLFADEFGGKGPKLTALYESVMGIKLEQKHRAMADVEALVDIVRRRRIFELEQQ